MTKGVKPCVVASANGNASKDEKGITCVQRAFTMDSRKVVSANAARPSGPGSATDAAAAAG